MDSKLYNFLGLIQKSGNLTSGDDGVEIDIKKGKCKLLIISEDASENTRKKFQNMANNYGVPYVIFGTKDDIGHFIGKSMRSVLSIKDKNLADAFIKKLRENTSGGDNIVKD
ncbi:L7Ae/L30e/S12e/Gadd45 family ribosomal protein [Thermobrachium celere]|uniref:Putative ribosomal protein n=1 Tax=Thermobrachium celere DSM 8682 TaxID=941824 RepID=R7RRG7_9CLOT|nr:ribosomal L7Ae/L30e/S12e/Gadd45 family protein [Thermobrachium celere]GFR36550.1 50S ribosomal protein L7/L12 [Thermobrachium celere]CDF57951.1 putative ribosomal protein [Thermobrachium celere DSM 8682]